MLIDEEEKHAVGEPEPGTAAERGPLVRLPDVAPVATAGFALPAMVLLLFGFFVIPLVIVVGFVGACTAVVLAARGGDAPSQPARTLWTVAALLLAVGFFVANATWSAQNVKAIRAPATNTLAGQWLVHHRDVRVPAQGEVFGDIEGISAESRGFHTDLLSPENVYAQGNHLLPAILGVTGWLGGPEALFRTNALIGALALLALFGLARRFVGDGFALAAAAALAVSLPMLAFSRDAYTEPLTLLLVFGGLSALWRAIESRRGSHLLVAGLTLGSASLARIDGYAASLAVVLVAVWLLAQAAPGERVAWLGRVGLLLGGMVVPASISYLDVTLLSSGYYHDLRGSILGLVAAGAALAALGAVVVAAVWWAPPARRLLAARARRWWSLAASGAVLATFAVLVSRPLWMTAHGDCRPSIGVLQRALVLAVDPCRTYAEHTVSWLAWYYGWPVVVAAVLGLALLVHRAVLTGDVRLVGVAVVVAGVSALYLAVPNVSPDQIWAMRRYLTVVVPGLLVAAGYLLCRLAARGRPYRVVAGVLALGFVAVPAYITHPMESVRTGVPQLAQVKAVCEALPDGAAVVSLGRAESGSYTQTMRSFCNVPSYTMSEPTAATLADVRASALRHGRTLFVIAELARFVPFAAGVSHPRPFYTAHVTRWPERLVDVPDAPLAYDVPVFLGIVNPNGTVTPVPRRPSDQ